MAYKRTRVAAGAAALAVLSSCATGGPQGTPRLHNPDATASAQRTDYAIGRGVAVAPWRRIRLRSHRLPHFPGTVAQPGVAWCTTNDLKIDPGRWGPPAQQRQLNRTVVVHDIGDRPCGLKGYPTVDALSPDSEIVGTDRLQTSFEAHPWIRLSPHHGSAQLGLGTADLGMPVGHNAALGCVVPVVSYFSINLAHHGGSIAIKAPNNAGGCKDIPRFEKSYPFTVGFWGENLRRPFGSVQSLRVRLSKVQRAVHLGGIEHFNLVFTGRHVRSVLRPCLPIHVDLSHQGPPVVSEFWTKLNCSAVRSGPLHQIVFAMQIRVPRHVRGRLWADVEWPLPIWGIYDVLDNGQFLPITILR